MMSVIKSDMFLNVLNLSFHFSESSLEKKKTFADNLFTPMSSKISISFFLQSKRN